jgi:hypothetical protein
MFGPMTVVTSSVLIMPDQHCFLRSRFSSQSYNGAGEDFTETVVGVKRIMTAGRHVSVSCLFEFDGMTRFMIFFLEMIALNENVDHAWSQFERYSTNSYMRQLLDDQAAVLAHGMDAELM